MSYNLFLDDIRKPMCLGTTKAWTTVRSYNEFVKVITERGLPNFISFDHDLDSEHYFSPINYLGFTEKTGYDCAKWLIEYCMRTQQPLPEWQVHSMNPVGKINIQEILTKFKGIEKDE